MLSEKVFQMFILGTGIHLDYALKQGVGGVIFFSHDIESKSQFSELIYNINNKSTDIKPFLSIDQEGGKVERTENIHERYLSPMYAFQKGSDFLKNQTICIAKELKEYGINMNFAPCIDVNSNPNNPIIGERAFSNNTNEVCRGFDIVAYEYSKRGIIPVVKHFPGHGDADKDSHKELPKITLSMKDMENIHIAPFKHAINKGIDVIMVAHLHCECFNKDILPTSLSANCINYLRSKLNFNGVIMSDDMYMNGVMKYGMVDACIMGIKAGLNMFIYRDASDSSINVIEETIKIAEKDSELRDKINYSYNKILQLKAKYHI